MIDKHVLIVGLGALGTRYLQALMKTRPVKVAVDIVEPNDGNFHAGVRVASQASNSSCVVAIKRSNHGTLRQAYDLVIVASTAAGRADIINRLMQSTTTSYWILEKVLEQSTEALEAIRRDLAGFKAWVNTPRRGFDFYASIKKEVKRTGLVEFEVIDENFSLCCNAIHFLDTLEWMGEGLLCSADLSSPSGWYEADREGFKEISGVFQAQLTNGAKLSIDNRMGVGQSYSVKLRDGCILIDEKVGWTVSNSHEHLGGLPLLSDYMVAEIERILRGDSDVSLAPLLCSIRQHEIFLGALKRANEELGLHMTQYPIT